MRRSKYTANIFPILCKLFLPIIHSIHMTGVELQDEEGMNA